MISTFHQVREMLEKRLCDAGLTKYVNKERSQFLDLDGEVFAEIVLNDASVLEDIERMVQSAADEMKTQGILLDSVVRALWEIISVEYSGRLSRTPDLSQARAAMEFQVILRSGTRQCPTIVNVSLGAIELLSHKLGIQESDASTLPVGHLANEIVATVVRKFVEQALSRGGTSYWDPLQVSQIELASTDMSFLMGQSTAFEELRQAISDAFEPPVLDSFLGSLEVSGIKLYDFDAVLPDLSNMLGGAYKRGETFSTNATDLYRRLDRVEQELLKKYFQGKLERLEKDTRFGGLAKKYANVFGPI